MQLHDTGARPSVARLRDLQYEIEQWLYLEAELIDDHRLTEWLERMADDVRYLVPLRSNRPRKDLSAAPTQPPSAHMEDDKAGLGVRVRRLLTGLAWSEDPPAKTRHLISNVRIHANANDTEFNVRSNFLIYVSRLAFDEDLYAGERHDALRRVDDECGFELVSRRVVLDQTTLSANNLSVFF
jgi:chlorobenzene dioxygenase small subunit/benzene/toluene dioxygenase beta subunit